MKKIHLKKNFFVLVDDDDYKKISKYKWYLSRPAMGYYYASTSINRKSIFLHKLLLEPSGGLWVDHINGNGLDNRRKNIRLATNSQNSANRKIQKNNTSGYKGVTWCKRTKKWLSSIMFLQRRYNLGYFLNKKIAASIYNKMAIKLQGDFAKINVL